MKVTNLAEVSGPLKDIANVIQLGFEKMASGGVVRATDDKAEVSGLKDSDDLEFGQPQKDLYDSRVVNWLGKRLYLGKDTQVSRLFWLLAKKPGVAHGLGEVQRAVDGMETDRDDRGDKEFKKAMNRLAKALATLRKRLRENDLDDHVIILKEGPNDWPSYTMISRFGRS